MAAYRNAQYYAPEEFRWPYYLGHLYRDLADIPKSQVSVRRALELKADYLPARLLVAEISLDEGRPEDAEPVLREILKLDASYVPALVALGKLALARKAHEEASVHLSSALDLAPTASEIHYPLGMAYRGLGELERARSFLERRGTAKAPAGDPLMAELRELASGFRLHQNRGNDAFLQGHYEQAARAFRKAVAADPQNAEPRANLAAALSRLQQPEEARAEIEEALRLDPQNASAHFALGTLLARAGRNEEAIDHYLQALAGDPGREDAHYNLANALRRGNRLPEAVEHYLRTVEINPRQTQARYGLALTLIQLERWPEAKASLETSHATFPEVAPLANLLARLLAACPQDALRDGPRALEIAETLTADIKSLVNVETLAMALAEVGRYPEAVGSQEAALAAARGAKRTDLETRLRANLDRYRAGKPSRKP